MKNHQVGWKITHVSSFCVTFFSHKNSWSKNSLEAPTFWWVPGDPPQKNGRKNLLLFDRNPKRNKKIHEKIFENWMFKEDEEKKQNKYHSRTGFSFENTSSIVQGDGGSIKNGKPLGEVGCFTTYTLSRWWIQILFIFTLTWGRLPFWLIFFHWVETTN